MKYVCCMVLILSVIFSIESFADDINTPSVIISTPSVIEVSVTDKDLFEDQFNDEEIEIFDSEFPDVREISDYDVAEYNKDLFLEVLSSLLEDKRNVGENMDTLDEALSIDSAMDREAAEDLSKSSLQIPLVSASGLKNVVVFKGSFNNYDAELVVPFEQYKYLSVIDGKLVNVGSTAVTGKILYDGESIDLSEYDSYVYVLNPIYSSTANVYNYGSFNYRRHYYLSNGGVGNRINYEDMYGNFLVDEVKLYSSVSERLYYAVLFIILLLGVGAIWSRH